MKTSLTKKKGAFSRWLNSLTKVKAHENTYTKPEDEQQVNAAELI